MVSERMRTTTWLTESALTLESRQALLSVNLLREHYLHWEQRVERTVLSRWTHFKSFGSRPRRSLRSLVVHLEPKFLWRLVRGRMSFTAQYSITSEMTR